MAKFNIVTFFVSFYGVFVNCGWTGAPFTGPPPTGMFPMGRKGVAEGGHPTGMPSMGRGSPPTPLPMKNAMRPSGSPSSNFGMPPTGIPPSRMPAQMEAAEVRQKRQQLPQPFEQQQLNQGTNFGNLPPFVGNPDIGMNGINQFGQNPGFASQDGFNGQQSGDFQEYPHQEQDRSLPTEYGQYNKKRSYPTEYGQNSRK